MFISILPVSPKGLDKIKGNQEIENPEINQDMVMVGMKKKAAFLQKKKNIPSHPNPTQHRKSEKKKPFYRSNLLKQTYLYRIYRTYSLSSGVSRGWWVGLVGEKKVRKFFIEKFKAGLVC